MKLTAYFLILSAAVLGAATLFAQDYEVVITNGRVAETISSHGLETAELDLTSRCFARTLDYSKSCQGILRCH